MATGGSIQSVSIAGRTFSVTGDSDSNRKLGGFENEQQANGDGTTRDIKTRVPWSIEGLSVSIDDDRGDQEFLQDVADGADAVVAITYPSGAVYQGLGNLTGDIAGASQSTSLPITLMGPGKLTKQ